MKTKKKAFTVVELVIVIAVIAILAAILIPTFSNIIRKANVSKDTQLVKNLNTALAIGLAESGKEKYQTAYDAMEAALNAGYVVKDIVATSSYDIAWFKVTGNFVLVDTKNSKAIYPSLAEIAELVIVADGTENDNRVDYFLVRSEMPKGTNAQKNLELGYSIFAGNGWEEADVVLNAVGFDAGYQTEINSITYKNTAAGAIAKDVLIRTNSNQDFIVEAKNDKDNCDTINHYGDANSVDIISNGLSSYHEFGGSLKTSVSEGAYVAETSSIVSCLTLNGNNGDVQVTLNTDSINGKIEVLANDNENEIVVNALEGSFTTELSGSSNLSEGSSFEKYTLNYNGDNDNNNGLIKSNHFAGIAAPSSDLYLENGGCLNKNTNEYEHAWLTKEDSTVIVCERCGAYRYTVVIEDNIEYAKEATYSVNYIKDNDGKIVKEEDDFPEISYDNKKSDDNSSDLYANAKTWIECVNNSYSLSGSGTKNDPYLLSCPRDLAFVAYKVINGTGNYSGAYYSITQDIDLSSKGWFPIGTFKKPFHGNIEGNNHKIIGLSNKNISNSDNIYLSNVFGVNCEVYGLIGAVGNGDFTAQNIVFENVDINLKNGSGVGALFGFAPDTEEFYEKTLIRNIGSENITVNNITVSGSIVAYNDAAGIVGKIKASKKTVISNCTNNANITVLAKGELQTGVKGGTGRCSGIVSQYDMETFESSLSVINNTNNGNISGYKEVTGIVKCNAHNNITITGNTNNGILTGDYDTLVYAIAEILYYGPKNIIVRDNINNNKDENLETIGYRYLHILEGETYTLTSAPESNVISNFGNLTINTSETITSIINNYNNLIIENGTFDGEIRFGNDDSKTTQYKGTGTINGGTFKKVISVYKNDAGTSELTINGGTFNPTYTALSIYGKCTINNGIFEKMIKIYDNGIGTIENGTFAGKIIVNNTDAGCSKLSIAGGTFSGAITAYGELLIGKGTFNSTITNYNNMTIADGTFSGKITAYGELEICKGTFNCTIANYNNMIIKDGIFSGYINYGNKSDSKTKHKGTGTIEGGTFSGNIYVYDNDAGSSELTITKGGTFNCKIIDYGELKINAGTFNKSVSQSLSIYGNCTIDGGDFSAFTCTEKTGIIYVRSSGNLTIKSMEEKPNSEKYNIYLTKDCTYNGVSQTKSNYQKIAVMD